MITPGRRNAALILFLLVTSGATADQHGDSRLSDAIDSFASAAGWRFVAVAGSTADPLFLWFGAAHPMMFGPPGLIRKPSRLSGAVISADQGSTPATYAVFDDLSARLESRQSEYRELTERPER